MRAFVRRHPFLLAGLATFGLFLFLETLSPAARATTVGAAFAALVRVLVAPLWLMRTVQMMLGIGAWPAILQLAIALPLLFAPYVLLDWILSRARRFRAHAAAV